MALFPLCRQRRALGKKDAPPGSIVLRLSRHSTVSPHERSIRAANKKENHNEHRQTRADHCTRHQQLGLLLTKHAGILLRPIREGIVLRQHELDHVQL
jgi:hypothetical protein